MNYSTAVFSVNPNLRAIKLAYEPAKAGRIDPDTVIYKTLDPNIKAGDFVVIETNTRWGYTVAKVIEVDVVVDFEAREEMGWIVDRVNYEKFKQITDEEKNYIKKMQEVEAAHRREEMRKKFEIFNNDSLKALPMATIEIKKETE